MTTKLIRHRIAAWVLLGAYAVFGLLWNLHHVVASEHHHHERKVCRTAPGETHIHSQEYAAIDCSICQLMPSAAELSPLLWPALILVEQPATSAVLGEVNCLAALPLTQAQPRAPPVQRL